MARSKFTCGKKITGELDESRKEKEKRERGEDLSDNQTAQQRNLSHEYEQRAPAHL